MALRGQKPTSRPPVIHDSVQRSMRTVQPCPQLPAELALVAIAQLVFLVVGFLSESIPEFESIAIDHFFSFLCLKCLQNLCFGCEKVSRGRGLDTPITQICP